MKVNVSKSFGWPFREARCASWQMNMMREGYVPVGEPMENTDGRIYAEMRLRDAVRGLHRTTEEKSAWTVEQRVESLENQVESLETTIDALVQDMADLAEYTKKLARVVKGQVA